MRLAGYDYRGAALFCEDVSLEEIAARAGTPCYVYSSRGILEAFHSYDRALAGLPHRVCYAVKANSNLAVLALLHEAGAGFDIVSGGELFRVLAAGGDPARVVFSGVGKTAQEIDYALETGIHSFNAESEPELSLLEALAARRGLRARVGLRVNPDVDAATHPYISTGLREHKFGIPITEAEGLLQRRAAWPHLALEGRAATSVPSFSIRRPCSKPSTTCLRSPGASPGSASSTSAAASASPTALISKGPTSHSSSPPSARSSPDPTCSC